MTRVNSFHHGNEAAHLFLGTVLGTGRNRNVHVAMVEVRLYLQQLNRRPTPSLHRTVGQLDVTVVFVRTGMNGRLRGRGVLFSPPGGAAHEIGAPTFRAGRTLDEDFELAGRVQPIVGRMARAAVPLGGADVAPHRFVERARFQLSRVVGAMATD